MAIVAEFKLTEEEARKALQDHSRGSLRLGVLRLWGMAGFIFLALFALIALSLDRPAQLWEPAAMVVLAWLIALPPVWIMAPKMASREIAPAFLELTEVRMDEDAFSVARAHSSGSGAWAHFSSWRELDDFFMLTHSTSVLLILPKRAFDDSAIEQLRELLSRVVRARDSLSPT